MRPALLFSILTKEGKMLSHQVMIILVAASLVCMSGFKTSAADTSKSIVGTWRVTSFSLTTLETNEVSRPFGENPIGYLQYSPGGHMVVFLSAAEMPKASLPYSDADRAVIYSRIFGAYAGTYTVDGNKVTHHVVASWRPEWVGGDQIRFAELSGDKLTIKTAPLASGLTGKQIVATLIDPSFTIRRFRDVTDTFSNNPIFLAGRDRAIEGMRLAGVPEG